MDTAKIKPLPVPDKDAKQPRGSSGYVRVEGAEGRTPEGMLLDLTDQLIRADVRVQEARDNWEAMMVKTGGEGHQYDTVSDEVANAEAHRRVVVNRLVRQARRVGESRTRGGYQ